MVFNVNCSCCYIPDTGGWLWGQQYPGWDSLSCTTQRCCERLTPLPCFMEHSPNLMDNFHKTKRGTLCKIHWKQDQNLNIIPNQRHVGLHHLLHVLQCVLSDVMWGFYSIFNITPQGLTTQATSLTMQGESEINECEARWHWTINEVNPIGLSLPIFAIPPQSLWNTAHKYAHATNQEIMYPPNFTFCIPQKLCSWNVYTHTALLQLPSRYSQEV